MKSFCMWLIGLVFAVGFLCAGCAPTSPPPKPLPTPVPVLTHPGQTPAPLAHVATGLDWIILIAVIGVGLGVALFFVVPAAHNLSIPIAGVAAGIEGSALLTRVSLWLIPWVAGGLVVLAAGVSIYEVYRNRVKLGLADAPKSSTAPTGT